MRMYSLEAFQMISPMARCSGMTEKKLLSAMPRTPMTAATGTLRASRTTRSRSAVASIAQFLTPCGVSIPSSLSSDAISSSCDGIPATDAPAEITAKQEGERAQRDQNQGDEEQGDAAEPAELGPREPDAQTGVGADVLRIARPGDIPGAVGERGEEDAEHEQRQQIACCAKAGAEAAVERVDAHMAARHEDVSHGPGGADGEQVARNLVRAREHVGPEADLPGLGVAARPDCALNAATQMAPSMMEGMIFAASPPR